MVNAKELAIGELLLMKERLPEQRKNMYVAMNLYKKQMTIDDIIEDRCIWKNIVDVDNLKRLEVIEKYDNNLTKQELDKYAIVTFPYDSPCTECIGYYGCEDYLTNKMQDNYGKKGVNR